MSAFDIPGAPNFRVRFWGRVNKTDDCWLWTGAVNSAGYGQIRQGGRIHYVHRLSYEDAHGPIPDGFQIDHLCRVRNCLRPEHLEAVTPGENTRRGEPARRTHCPRGHEYDLLNTYIDGNGRRVCRACHRMRERERQSKEPICQ